MLQRKEIFLWDALWPGKLDLTGGASQSCEGRFSPRKPPYLADALCSGTQGKAVVQISTATMLLCNKRPLLWRKGEVVWRRQLHVVCNLGPEVKPDRPLSSGRLPQGGIVATEGKKKASPLAPRRKSVPEGRGMQGGALRAFATPSEAPPCGFWAKPQGEKEKRKKLFFCVSLSRFPGLAARRKRKEEKTSLCPSPFSHKKRSGFLPLLPILWHKGRLGWFHFC